MKKRGYLVIAPVVAVAVLLVILLGIVLGNEPPRVVSLSAEPDSVIPSGTCLIVCHAVDPDGNPADLSYEWSASQGEITGDGASASWIAPNSLGSYNITVRVTDPRGAKATGQKTIEVRVGEPPVILSLMTDAPWVTPSGSLQVICTASDPDGDQLSYDWYAGSGNISSTGEVASWAAPQEVGIYYLTVAVRDNHGGSATKSLAVSVATAEPPNIESLVVTADHCYLKEYSWGYKVGKGQKYSLTCAVSNMSTPVSYNWSCGSGDISGGGPTITWTAPSPPDSVDTTVTVVVSDSAGNMMAKSVVLNVVQCSPCTFGC